MKRHFWINSFTVPPNRASSCGLKVWWNKKLFLKSKLTLNIQGELVFIALKSCTLYYMGGLVRLGNAT